MVLVIALMCSGVGGKLESGLRIAVLALPIRDFFTVVFFEVAFFVVAFLEVDFFAVAFLAVGFLAVAFLGVDFVVFLTGFFLVAMVLSPWFFSLKNIVHDVF
jgi:hypothetical protein